MSDKSPTPAQEWRRHQADPGVIQVQATPPRRGRRAQTVECDAAGAQSINPGNANTLDTNVGGKAGIGGLQGEMGQAVMAAISPEQQPWQPKQNSERPRGHSHHRGQGGRCHRSNVGDQPPHSTIFELGTAPFMANGALRIIS